MATYNCHRLLNICGKKHLQQIPLASTENCFYLQIIPQEDSLCDDAIATLQMEVDIDQVKEPITQLLNSAKNASSKRLQGKLYTDKVQKFHPTTLKRFY
jgi:uncharacterized protein YcgL (UPF0745 family)